MSLDRYAEKQLCLYELQVLFVTNLNKRVTVYANFSSAGWSQWDATALTIFASHQQETLQKSPCYIGLNYMGFYLQRQSFVKINMLH